ncbi:MAG: type II toxin-antitoxin system Phd/YefM family antitoxin [Caldilineaceae bacterium]
MTVETVTSEYARINLRDILDASIAGSVYVIERYRKPTAVVISYGEWEKTQKRLHDLELLLEVKQTEAKVPEGELEVITHDEWKRFMLTKQAEEGETAFSSSPIDTTDASAAVARLTTLFADVHLDDLDMHLSDPSLALAHIDLAHL